MITMRRYARRLLPEMVRLAVARMRRGMRDRMTGDAGRIVRKVTREAQPLYRIVHLTQPIRDTGLAGKLANIRLGAARLDGVVIAPGQIFSFWALVGEPSARAGFALGRSIRGGVVAGEFGGGLCQVSGIAYEALLRGGLDPVERHPHSRDLYDEDERFTLLGLDATVVWPYRDLRLVNRFDVPVMLSVRFDGLTIAASLHAGRAVAPMAIEVERTDHPGWRYVSVMRDAVIVSRDRYEVAAS